MPQRCSGFVLLGRLLEGSWISGGSAQVVGHQVSCVRLLASIVGEAELIVWALHLWEGMPESGPLGMKTDENTEKLKPCSHIILAYPE